MKTLTEDQIKFLSRFESNFKTVTEAGYTRGISRRDIKALYDIYKDFSEDNSIQNIYCSSCLVNMLKKLSSIYHNNIYIWQDNEEHDVNAEKPKKSRKKATNKVENKIQHEYGKE